MYTFYNYCYVVDDPEKKSKFLRKHLESESEIREMLKPPKPKTAAELVSEIKIFFNNRLLTYI